VVEAGSGGVPAPARTVVAPQGGTDLRFIRLGDPALVRHRKNMWSSATFWMMQLLPLIALAGIFLYARHEERVATDQGYAPPPLGKDARRRHPAPAALSERGRARVPRGCGAGALAAWLIARTGRRPASRWMSQGDLRQSIPALGKRFARCLERCDFGRFAPATGRPSAPGQAEEILTALARAGL
jgi:hypothetical protein